MKLSHHTAAGIQCITLRGDVLGQSCDCLRNFWDRYVTPGTGQLEIDMTGVDAIDSQAIAQLVDLLRECIAGGARPSLESPPQVLAHTLYKVGLLREQSPMTIRNPRVEEPYAG